ncbi:MAG: hypothetical protein BGO69_10300 [Bacteroidetes bacterium 46-16]|nr:MAG: hypothetical protein BGO69_10300 [Bacteroidetes bacterium 46-16]
MNGELKHIFDESACLSRRQLKDYVSGQMANEECHAVEHHLNGCPLCSSAIDGMLLDPAKALETVTEMNTDFLKEHFMLKNPQANTNTAAPAAPIMETPKPGAKMKPFWRTAAAAAAIFAVICLFWYIRSAQRSDQNVMIAQKFDDEKNARAAAAKAEAEQAPKPVAEENTLAATAPSGETASPPETVPAQQAVTASAEQAGKVQQNEAPAADMAAAKKASDEQAKMLKQVPPALADNKKALAEKAKNTPEAKKPGSPETSKLAVGNNTRNPAKDEHHASTENVVAAKEDKSNKNKAATETVHTLAQPAAPAPAARNEASADAASGAGANSAEKLPEDKLDRGKYYFKKQKWSEALAEYKGEINNASKSKRHEASYMAAQCYVKLGNNKEAERLLKIIVDEGGAEKRHAKKLLESIDKQ